MRMDSDGAASLFGFLTATTVFAVSFAVVVQVSVEHGDEAPDNGYENRAAEAASLANLILTDPGRGWYGALAACLGGQPNTAAFDPEALERFGIAQERCGGTAARERVTNLSFDKMRNLRRAEFDPDATNGAVDYLEARDSLHLTESGLNFHVRSWPILPDIDAMLSEGYRDPNLRPLYVGDYERLQGGQSQNYDVQRVAGAVYTADTATLFVNITNNGTTPTAFSVAFAINTQKAISVEKHSGPVAAGGWANVTFVVNKTADWQWKQGVQKYDYVVRDPSQAVGEGTVTMQAMTHAETRTVYVAEATQLSWLRSGGTATVEVRYEGLDGRGNKENVNGWTLEIRDSADALVATAGSLDDAGGTEAFTLNAADAFRAVLKAPAGWIAQSDTVNVVDSAFEPFTPSGGATSWVSDPPVAVESAFIAATVENFDPGVVDQDYDDGVVTWMEGGDIYPDDNAVLSDRLPAVLEDTNGDSILTNYNMLFMGTNVDHRTLTSASVKLTIRDWVLAGGTLVVFGSDNQAVQWLEPLFHVALQSAGAGVSTPDSSHPVLHTPNEIDYASMDPHGTAWHFNRDEDKQYFSHVVVSGSDDVLSVSNPGAFGNGRIVLTSWQPYDATLGAPGADCAPATLEATCAGLQLIGNFITIGYSDLYLDYGPEVLASVPQGVSSRIAFVYHPELERPVDVHVLVYVFG